MLHGNTFNEEPAPYLSIDWVMRAVASPRSRTRAPVRGARKEALASFIEPCDPVLREHPPTGPGWRFEIKADGYRVQVHLQNGEVTVYSRTGLNWTDQFATIAAAAKSIKAATAVIDGEAVVYGETGLPDFQALRRELGPHASKRVRCHAFDLVYLNGYDLRDVQYVDRKRLLGDVLTNTPATFVFAEYLDADGRLVFDQACKMGLEGIVAKRADAPYRSGRQESWIKLKCTKSDTYPIIALLEKLGAKPRKIDAEVEYSAITDDGLLRAAVFKGLREDLALPAVNAPSIRPSARLPASKPHIGVPRQNILQLLPDAVIPTKGQLREYWQRIWKQALPHLGHRLLKLVRHVHGTTFYHKGLLPKDIPQAVHQLRIKKREGGEGVRLWVDSLDGFLGLVEIGAVELHPWNATVDDFEHADRLVIDFDPGEGVSWDEVVDAALGMRDVLKAEGLATWPKLTGGKGIHVMCPLARQMTHDEAHRYARRLVTTLSHRDPGPYVLSAQAKRRGRIFLDYLRNGRGTTAIGAYSPRAREGFPIAAPVSWSRVEAGILPDAFSLESPFHARREEAERRVRAGQ